MIKQPLNIALLQITFFIIFITKPGLGRHQGGLPWMTSADPRTPSSSSTFSVPNKGSSVGWRIGMNCLNALLTLDVDLSSYSIMPHWFGRSDRKVVAEAEVKLFYETSLFFNS